MDIAFSSYNNNSNISGHSIMNPSIQASTSSSSSTTMSVYMNNQYDQQQHQHQHHHHHQSHLIEQRLHEHQQPRRRRGRPCALERQNNELLQAQFSTLISQSALDFDSDFAKLNIIPFIARRQRRARANDRERTRMQTLNEALDVLKSYLPLEYLVAPSSNREDRKTSQSSAILKLTKIDTLKLATKYIGILTDLLSENGQQVGDLDLSSRWSWSYAATESASSTESLSPSLAVSSSSPSSSSTFQPPVTNSSSSSNGFNSMHHHSNHQQQFMNVYQNSSVMAYSSTQLLNSQDLDRFYY